VYVLFVFEHGKVMIPLKGSFASIANETCFDDI
jgi:hypothetical protein